MQHIDKILFIIGAIAFGLSFLDSNDRQGLILGISFMLPLFINWFFELEIVVDFATLATDRCDATNRARFTHYLLVIVCLVNGFGDNECPSL